MVLVPQNKEKHDKTVPLMEIDGDSARKPTKQNTPKTLCHWLELKVSVPRNKQKKNTPKLQTDWIDWLID